RYVWQPKNMGEVAFTLAVRNLFDNLYVTNGWVYRYISAGYDARPDDPYARLEHGNQYNLTGYYPQAPRNLLAGISIKF
ncbi:MAG: TonB-dependent receptor, partial [Bacteroidetes bacterium]